MTEEEGVELARRTDHSAMAEVGPEKMEEGRAGRSDTLYQGGELEPVVVYRSGCPFNASI